MYRKEVIIKMGAVERECRAAVVAVSELLRRADADPTLLHTAKVVHADVRNCLQNVENTYLVRLFAVFEEALREVRRVVYGRGGPIKTHALIQQCAARQHVGHDYLTSAHAVREYRNAVVHGGD